MIIEEKKKKKRLLFHKAVYTAEMGDQITITAVMHIRDSGYKLALWQLQLELY